MQLKKKNYLFLLFALLCFCIPYLINNNSAYSSSGVLESINKSLERLEKEFQSQNYYAICKEASQSAKNIKNNQVLLSKSEPYYNWTEIKEVLLEISDENCKKAD